MRILFVGMPNSIHAASWVRQIIDQGWDVRLFPVYRAQPHPTFHNITFYSPLLWRGKNTDASVRYLYHSSPFDVFAALKRIIPAFQGGQFREHALARVIQSFKPDIIHSLEIQHAGYLTLEAKKKHGKRFPIWIATSWGSDLYLFGRLPEHKPKIEAVLSNCDLYSCDCQRDILIAKNLGYKGKTLPVFPDYGGFDLKKITTLKDEALPASRRIILLKGYQHWAGRALVGLRALAMCADQLKGYRVSIYGASPDVALAAELFSQDTQIPVNIISRQSSDDDILKIFGQARIAIGLSISDGLPKTMLESMVMGAFPIQSCTACADEWIVDGKSGFIVPPEDPGVVAEAIRKALVDDNLVNHAAELNAQTARERLDYRLIQPQVIALYERVAAHMTVKREGVPS